jgi:hypothetical protein
MKRPELAFATPRKLPKAGELKGRVVVLDVAFASEASGGGFDKITKPLIDGLGARLAAWVDHHDHTRHVDYAGDPRFVLTTKAEHGACPEIVTPEVVARAGPVDTIVCHTDFDGLASAAKWIRGGAEPYPGCDDDARAIDTRIGLPGPLGARLDRAIRARSRDHGLFGLVVRHLTDGLADAALWAPIDAAARELDAIEERTRKVAERYRVTRGSTRSVAFIDASDHHAQYDKTLLLLIGQERADVAVLLDRDTLSLAAPFDSGVSFLEMMSLSGGMPTLVSVPATRAREALEKLGLTPADITSLLG